MSGVTALKKQIVIFPLPNLHPNRLLNAPLGDFHTPTTQRTYHCGIDSFLISEGKLQPAIFVELRAFQGRKSNQKWFWWLF